MLKETILAAAKKVGIAGQILLAICSHESGLKNVLVKNDGGSPSFGICQIKYSTAAFLGFSGKEKDLMKPDVNAKFAAQYFKYQLNRYDGNLCMAIASYNAGSFLESEKFPGYPKNMKYVNKIKEKLDHRLKKHVICGNTEIAMESKR